MIRFHFIYIGLTWVLITNCEGKEGLQLQSSKLKTCFPQKQTNVQKTEKSLLDSLGFVNIKQIDTTIQVNLKYSTTDNFTKKILYKTLKDAYLHPIAAKKIIAAQAYLKGIDPNLSLLIYDATRPHSVQKIMYDAVKDTKYHLYVAHPSRTSIHNYGMAVDLTICNNNGIPLDMGTDFDYFGKAAGITQEENLIAQGILTREQVRNRKLLRNVMKHVGFIPIKGEWWHFNAVSLQDAKKESILIR